MFKITSLHVWLAWKLVFHRRVLLNSSTLFSILGLALGVACLFVSMAVFSGFELTLKRAMADITGHVRLVKTTRPLDDWTELEKKVQTVEPDLASSTRFISLEAVVAHQGQVRGVGVQGVDHERINQVLSLSSRLVAGSLDVNTVEQGPQPALVGRGLAQKMQLDLGEEFRIIVPIHKDLDPNSFQRRVAPFKVVGILDMGKYEWNERFILTNLKAAQDLAQIGDKYTGLILRFKNFEQSREAGFRLNRILGSDYYIRDWRDPNENLFDAIIIERVVIFFVVFIIVMVAAFNIAISLYVNVVQRYNSIALLKTLGFKSKDVKIVFSLQGLFIGSMGLIIGYAVGLILCWLFIWAQAHLNLLPGSVYKIDHVDIDFRWIDFIAISFSTLGICFVATLAPSAKGSRLTPVEGLRYV